jgi:CheY-like chemotaxis protein
MGGSVPASLPFPEGQHLPSSATIARGSWTSRDPLPHWPSSAPTSGDEAVRRPTRVLIADDNARTRAALRALLLTTPGIKVVGEAGDGETAARLTASVHPDVVLMDVRMPGMDGIEATRLIKTRQPGVRVVVLTISAAYRIQAMAAGADAFLVKGGPADELVSAVLGADDPGPRRRSRRSADGRRPAGRRHRPHGPMLGVPLV